jgi:hypothetical protein
MHAVDLVKIAFSLAWAANIIIAAVYIPFTLFNLAGENWMHMVFGAVAEIFLLCLIILHAWKLPRV